MPDRTILLIDFDTRSIEDNLRSLTAAGYKVEVATDGLSGLEAFNRLHPDLVLIEPMVPRKHGFEVCKEIKESEDGQETPVLITTGFYTGQKHQSQARKLYGCDDYLEKPFSGQMLLSACRRYLEEPEAVVDDMPTDDEIDAAVWEEVPEPAPVEAPQAHPSLGDLTEEEIVAHLDALIVETPGAPQAEEDPEPPVMAVEPREEPPREAEAEPRGASKMTRLLLVAAGTIAVIAAGYFVTLRIMEGGDTAPIPAENGAEIAPVPVAEKVNEPEATIAEEPVPVEVAAPEQVVEREEPPPKIAKPKRTPKPRAKPLPDAEFTGLEPDPEPTAELEPAAFGQVPVVELEQAPTAPPKPKAKFGELVDIATVDSPPVPLNKQPPAYNPIARRLRQEGTVLLQLLIDEHGYVERVEVVSNNAGEILQNTAVSEAKRWTYRPAKKDGVAVKVWSLERVVFKL